MNPTDPTCSKCSRVALVAPCSRRVVSSTHGDYFACPGLLLVTPDDVAEFYRRSL